MTHELMVDNWIIFHTRLAKVTFVSEKKIGINANDFHDVLSPVLTTPKWLENLGFQKVPSAIITRAMEYPIGRDRYISVQCVGTPNEMVLLTEVDPSSKVENLIVLRNYDYDGKTYVHQIQNLITILNWKK